jgi:hypothetical protein
MITAIVLVMGAINFFSLGARVYKDHPSQEFIPTNINYVNVDPEQQITYACGNEPVKKLKLQYLK